MMEIVRKRNLPWKQKIRPSFLYTYWFVAQGSIRVNCGIWSSFSPRLFVEKVGICWWSGAWGGSLVGRRCCSCELCSFFVRSCSAAQHRIMSIILIMHHRLCLKKSNFLLCCFSSFSEYFDDAEFDAIEQPISLVYFFQLSESIFNCCWFIFMNDAPCKEHSSSSYKGSHPSLLA